MSENSVRDVVWTEEPPALPALRGERLAGIVLARSGPLAAGLVLAIGVLAAILVPFGAWRPLIVVPLLLVIVVGLVRIVGLVPAQPAAPWTALACVAIAAGHGWWAAATHAQHLVLRRDAGSYALYTQWIATRHGLPLPSYLDAFGGSAALADPAFRLASPAFFAVMHGPAGAAGTTVDIVPQFLLGAPAVYSLGWWADGWTGLLVTPAIISALGLLAIAGLAVRLCGAPLAVPVVAALALAQPVLHAARSTYSEPLALLLLAAASALLVDAVKQGNRRRPGSRELAFAAGLGFGLAGLVRVDSVREVAFLLPVAAVLALRAHPAARPLVVGGLGGTLLAAIPAVLLSRPYLGQVAPSLLPLLAGGVMLGVLSLIAVRLGARRAAQSASMSGTGRTPSAKSAGNGGTTSATNQVGTSSAIETVGTTSATKPPGRDGHPSRETPPRDHANLRRAWGRRWPRLMAGAVVLIGLLLASRPLWMITRQDPNDPGSRVVAGLQLQQGLKIDGGRTYAEHSLTWMSWYLGPVMLIAALVVFAGLAHRATRWWLRSGALSGAGAGAGSSGAGPGAGSVAKSGAKSGAKTGAGPTAGPESGSDHRFAVPVWLGPAVIGLAGSLLTLYRPGITPDHPWADRRFVPLVLPTIVIAAGAGVAWLGRYARRRWPASLLLAVLAATTVSMLLPPWLATAPVARQRTEQGELTAVHQVCSQFKPGDVVLAVDNRAANEWPQVVRGICGKPAATIKVTDPADDGAAPVRRIASRIVAAGGHPVLLAGTPEGAELLRNLALSPAQVVNLSTTEDQRYLTRVPDGSSALTVQVWLARWPVSVTG